MAKLVDLTGQKFGKLTVLSRGENHIRPSGQKVTTWICKCDCGNIKTIEAASLKKGISKSCGCLRREPKENLSGKKYGRLLVLEQDKLNSKKWICLCECGKEVSINGKTLKNGSTQSCGCLRNQRVKETVGKNEIGNKYGKLTVIEEDKSRSTHGLIQWVCQCECGNTTIVPGAWLRSGNTKSCGCLNRELTKKRYKTFRNDYIGKIYNYMEVTGDAGTENQKSFVYCKCLNCGKKNIKTALGDLKSNKIFSCGCLKSSKGEIKIENILKENNIRYEKEKSFDTCRFEGSNRLARFDFYLPDYNILVEYDGEQHFFSRENGWNTEENLKKVKERDLFKTNWCLENNITLVRIPYTEYLSFTIKDILKGEQKWQLEEVQQN